jgi:hypothetical protein
MAHAVITGSKIFVAHFDISGHLNAHAINKTQDLPDDTCYGDTFKQRLPGLQHMNFSIAGNVDLAGASDSDTILQARMGVADVPLIIAPVGSAIGDPAEFGLIEQGQYAPTAKIGEILKFGCTGELANRRWVLGKVLWAPSTVISGTANGAEVLIGATSATQKIYVAIAVIASNLTTMTVRVESDTTGFASATVQKTFTAVTDVTSEMPTPVDGAVTDTYFRAAVSAFTGTTAQMIVVAGIA